MIHLSKCQLCQFHQVAKEDTLKPLGAQRIRCGKNVADWKECQEFKSPFVIDVEYQEIENIDKSQKL